MVPVNKTNHFNGNEVYSHPSTSTSVPIYNVKQEMVNHGGTYRSTKGPVKKKYPDLTQMNDLKEVSINCQQMAFEQAQEEERIAQELIDKIDNDVDLSNATLAPEEEKNNSNTKIQKVGLEKDEKKDEKKKKKLKKKKSYVFEDDDNVTCKCCCRYCCLCLCFLITVLIIGGAIILCYFFYPRIPTINLIDMVVSNETMATTLNSLKSYNNYRPQIERYISYQNLDFTFDFNVTFLIKSENMYNYNFTDVQIELTYPGTQETPRFRIAHGYLDTLSIDARAVSIVEVPMTSIISFQNLLEKGYFYNVFSACTWDMNFKGFWKFHGLKSNRLIINYDNRFTRVCLMEDILNQLRQLYGIS